MQGIKVFATRSCVAVGQSVLRLAARPRGLRSSKRTNGSVVVVAGSRQYHGSAALASSAVQCTLASLRIGTGYAYLLVPGSIEAAVRRLSPNVIVRTFGTEDISDGDVALAKEMAAKADAVVIGMGIGRGPSALRMAARIIGIAVKAGKKVVVDADAIYAVKYAGKLNGNVILTPHDGEFRALAGFEPGATLAWRSASAAALSKKTGAVVLLKGHETVVTDGIAVAVVKSRSSALATMGTGDVLSGMIGGYAATGCSALVAAEAGAYLHSRIGDILAREKGAHILASDIVELIPRVIKAFDKEIT